MTFTPGVNDDRTDTYEAQIKLQEDDQTAEEQFAEAQRGLKDANTWFQRALGIYGALTNEVAPTATATIDAPPPATLDFTIVAVVVTVITYCCH